MLCYPWSFISRGANVEQNKFHKMRFLTYILSKILMIVVVFLIALFAFFSAKNTMNVKTMLKDGMAKRAAAILNATNTDQESNDEMLKRLFTEEYLEKSGLLNHNVNGKYEVKSFNQAVNVDFKVVLAWDWGATVTVTDQMFSINATNLSDEEKMPSIDDMYESGVYEIHLVRNGGEWRIDNITLKERIYTAQDDQKSEEQ